MCDKEKKSNPDQFVGQETGESFAEGRQSARCVLQDSIRQKELELMELQTLEKAINWDLLSRGQESQLWNYFISNR